MRIEFLRKTRSASRQGWPLRSPGERRSGYLLAIERNAISDPRVELAGIGPFAWLPASLGGQIAALSGESGLARAKGLSPSELAGRSPAQVSNALRLHDVVGVTTQDPGEPLRSPV